MRAVGKGHVHEGGHPSDPVPGSSVSHMPLAHFWQTLFHGNAETDERI